MADYYTATGQPANKSSLTSSVIRAEFAAVAAGLAKIAPYTGHGGEVLRINAGATAQESVPFSTLLATIGSLVIAGTLSGVTDLTTTGNTILGNAQADTLNVGAGDIQKDASGRTGFGVAPAAKVHVKATGELVRIETTTARGSGAAYLDFYDPTGQKGYIGYQGANDLMSVWNVLNGAVLIGSNNAEVARFDPNGLGVGRSAAANYPVDVAGTIRSIGGEATTGYGLRVLNAAQNGGGSFSAITGAAAGVSLSGDAGPVKISANSVTNMLTIGGSGASGIELVAASNSIIVRQTSSAGYAGMRIYNDQNSALRSLEIDYTGSAYASGLTGGPTGEQGNVVTTGAFPLIFGTNNAMRLQITGAGLIQDAAGNELGYRRLPDASITTGTVIAADSGKCVYASGGVTIPNGVFARGDMVTIQNTTAGSITITQGASHTLILRGTGSTGNRTLGPFGAATVLFNNGTSSFISGSGVT